MTAPKGARPVGCAPVAPEAGDPHSARPAGIRRSRSSRRRATVLILVHVAMLAHLTHWLVTGRTVSPVEPSESMFFLERGEVNAGLVFFALAILSTVIFGRFFCGWGCHIVALQDLCGWFMKRIGIRPRMFRSRLLMLAPLALALYMFAWPSFLRWIVHPALRAWWPEAYAWLTPLPHFPEFTNHLVTEDFWATFASPLVAVPFLAVCGFATVYFLGAKGFCTYGCPYGGLFTPVDRVAFGQILADLDLCEKCGHCTATCTSNVRVHQEIQEHRKVVNPGCMKCLDCVSVCPTGALRFGFARPRLFARRARTAQRKSPARRYDLSWPEELALTAFGLGAFWSVRGLYAVVPMLFAIGIAACLTFAAWKGWRLLRDPEVSLHRFALRRGGRLQTAGVVYAALLAIGLALLAHSAVIKTQLAAAEGHYQQVARGVSFRRLLDGLPADYYRTEVRVAAAAATRHYERTLPLWRGGWGLMETAGLHHTLARMALARGDLETAEAEWSQAAERRPQDEASYLLARVRALRGDLEGAEETLKQRLAEYPDSPDSRRELAHLYLGAEPVRPEAAEALYRERLAAAPADVLARCRLAVEVLARGQRHPEAANELRALLEFPQLTDSQATVVMNSFVQYARFVGPQPETVTLLEEALARQPDWFVVRRELVLVLRAREELAAAEALLLARLEQAPQDHATRLLLAVDVFLYRGEAPAAERELQLVYADGSFPSVLAGDLQAAYNQLVRTLAHQGDLDRARQEARKRLIEQPDWNELRATLAQLEQASGLPAAAQAVYEEHLARRPHDAHLRARYAISILGGLQGRKAEALAEMERAVRSAPHDGMVRADLALARFQNGDLTGAVATMREALALAPHHLPSVHRMTELLDLADEHAEADRLRQVLPILQRPE